jgi:hypothetical protein
MGFVYFLYSEEQIEEKNKILAGMSKMFQPGRVSVGANRLKFSQISTEPTLPRFVDTKIVASGEESSFTYVPPQNVDMRGNNI